MMRGTLLHAYLKVELQSRFPKIWVWKIRQNDSDELVQRSAVGFNNADDAWFAGSRVLTGLEAQHTARQLLQQAA